MKKRFLSAFAVTLFLSLGSQASHAIIMLSFDAATTDVSVGDTFSVDLIADIPNDEAINSWGLDLAFDTGVLSLNSFTRGGIWGGGLGLCSFDGDEICGNALVPSVTGITTLGTFEFTAVALGSSALNLSVTANDITEGFRLSTAAFPIADRAWDYTTGLVNVGPAVPTPEPTTLALLSLGLAGIGFVRQRRVNTP